MSMVTSCTHVLSRAAPPAKLPHGALQSGKPAAMALQRKPRPLSVRCDAENAGHAFDIVPFELTLSSKENLEVRVNDDELLVRSKGAVDAGEPASSLDVRLLVPNGYDKRMVEAVLTFGSLQVTFGKHKPVDDKIESVEISPNDLGKHKPVDDKIESVEISPNDLGKHKPVDDKIESIPKDPNSTTKS